MGLGLEFRILGPLQVWAGDTEIAVPAGRHRTLLAALLLRANRVVTTDELVSWIWGDTPPRDARATTQTYVHRLRRVLGPGFLSRPGGYLIAVDGDQLDLSRFDALLERAGRATDRTVEARLLGEALALWRGPALANVPSDSLHREEVPALHERRLHALQRRLALDLLAGRHGDVVAELRALTSEHPLREQFWAQLMTALAGSGRPAEALQAYHDLRTFLAEELGADPGPELADLHRTILRGDPPPAAAASVPTPPHTAVPAQLPPDVHGFTGRTGELRRLDALLDRRDSAVVISSGPVQRHPHLRPPTRLTTEVNPSLPTSDRLTSPAHSAAEGNGRRLRLRQVDQDAAGRAVFGDGRGWDLPEG